MRRREFLGGLGSVAMLPPSVRAQPSAMPVVGGLAAPAEATYKHHVAAIQQGLKEAGFVEGQNVRLEFRWADGRYDRLGTLAADLVDRDVDVIITLGGSPPVLAAKAATSSIRSYSILVPIRFDLVSSPV